MTHASLFSGIGGAEIAAEWMGWKNLFHCEIEEFPRRVLDYWFPNAESYEDIRKTNFKKWGGKVDVLTGGFPCQPFSVAGRRDGEKDNRYLWQEMYRAIQEINPTWIVGENVAGITTMVESSKTTYLGRKTNLFDESDLYREESVFTLERICQDLENIGYEVQPLIIPACAVGAPHRRDRVWIVAYRSNTRTEEVQQQDRQNGVLSFKPTTDTYSIRQRRRKNEQKHICKLIGETDTCTCGKDEALANSKCVRGCEIYNNLQSTQPNGKKPYCNGDKWYVGNKDRPQKRWDTFPSESPLCSRYDGLPFNVDSLTISFAKWRQESIRAYGNAWVPQVAYEIFNSIQSAFNKE